MSAGSVVCSVLDIGVSAPDGGRAPRRRPRDAWRPWLDNGLDLACFFFPFSVGDLNLTCMLQLVLFFFYRTPYILIL
jgi:hypothetical protein